MLYPYVVYETWALYLVGCGLCIAAWRQRPLRERIRTSRKPRPGKLFRAGAF
ncbi:MAG: hypothetical protein U1F11_00765 [Steroidobacteraceae bacterium]